MATKLNLLIIIQKRSAITFSGPKSVKNSKTISRIGNPEEKTVAPDFPSAVSASQLLSFHQQRDYAMLYACVRMCYGNWVNWDAGQKNLKVAPAASRRASRGMINARNNPHSESTPQNVELPAFVRIDASVGKKDFPYCHFFRQPDQQKNRHSSCW